MLNENSKERAYQDAEFFFRGLLNIDNDDHDARRALAYALFLRGQIAQAEQQFFRLLRERHRENLILFRKKSIE